MKNRDWSSEFPGWERTPPNESLTSEPNTAQHGGDHYLRLEIQPWDFIVANDIGYLEGSAIKYLARWKNKGGLQDLHKAKHFVEKLIEVHTVRQHDNT